MFAERQQMEVDITCIGFGPAMAGFLHTLSKSIADENGQTLIESKAMPGMPLQVVCYERADDISFGVSGIVTNARAIRESFSREELSQIPMSHPVTKEELYYLADPFKTSRRSGLLKTVDALTNRLSKNKSLRLPFLPAFLNKHDGIVLTMGQFMQWIGEQLMGTGLVQIWPGTPVQSALIENNRVKGIRLTDQGVNKKGEPDSGYMPGMDVMASLTVLGEGPVGWVGQQLNRHFGMPKGNHLRDWAIGMKSVAGLDSSSPLKPGTVIHTMGYPEPEIFGFLYGLPDKKASLGIFVPSWFDNPIRNCYRYFQHWMQHPQLSEYLKGASLLSWGAKSLQEDGIKGEPFLVGDGFARIGEGSGCTNILSNSGVDEAWKSGTLLGDAVVHLLKSGQPFSRQNLEKTYVKARSKSWITTENLKAKGARDGFQKGFVRGMMGMGLAGFSGGKLKLPGEVKRPHEKVISPESYFNGVLSSTEIQSIREKAVSQNTNMYNAVMNKCGWPEIKMDGHLFISHQDALLTGGKVQAPMGHADHVIFTDPVLCKMCDNRRCVDMCSGQAITPGPDGIPLFDREKCIHCGACFWNCTRSRKDNPEESNIEFRAGTGGLHSAEN